MNLIREHFRKNITRTLNTLDLRSQRICYCKFLLASGSVNKTLKLLHINRLEYPALEKESCHTLLEKRV